MIATPYTGTNTWGYWGPTEYAGIINDPYHLSNERSMIEIRKDFWKWINCFCIRNTRSVVRQKFRNLLKGKSEKEAEYG